MSLLSKALGKVADVGRAVVAPVTMPVVAAGKLVTSGLAATGARPFRQLDQAVGKELGAQVTVAATHLGVGAAVGAVVAGKPQLGALASGAAGRVGGLVKHAVAGRTPPASAAVQPTTADTAAPPPAQALTFGDWLWSLLGGAK